MDLVNKGIKDAHYDAMYLSLFVAFLGILIAVLFYYLKKINLDRVSNVFNYVGLYNLSRNKFYIDKIYSTFLYKPFMKFSKIIYFFIKLFYPSRFI